MMNIAMLKYTEWTATAAKQISEVVADPAITARMRQAPRGAKSAEALSMTPYMLLNPAQRAEVAPALMARAA